MLWRPTGGEWKTALELLSKKGKIVYDSAKDTINIKP